MQHDADGKTATKMRTAANIGHALKQVEGVLLLGSKTRSADLNSMRPSASSMLTAKAKLQKETIEEEIL